ncbi:MAG: hypothetical protein ABL966_00800 [Acidimicrobiales bacterium]
MRALARWFASPGGLRAHAVDVAFMVVAVGWLAYILRITREFSFWSDDLFLIEQAGSFGGLFEPYNDHMSLVILSIYRASAELASFSYTPFMVAGALSLIAVPVAFYATTRSRLTAPLAAILATPLVWYESPNLRPSSLNHYLALLGGVVAAAALNRGRRADGVLAGALAFSLCSAGGGVVVAAACIGHCVLVRPPWRRWLAVLVPTALWAAWWLLVAEVGQIEPAFRLTNSEAVEVVRDLCLSPFYVAAFHIRPLAYLLMVAFVAHGVAQVRLGLRAGANFLAWSAASVLWAYGLVRSRGFLADPQSFRYAFLAMGFTLLAVVPRQPIRWSVLEGPVRERWLVAAAAVVLLLGGVRAIDVRASLQDFAEAHAQRGREARGTLIALELQPEVIPDDTPMGFFGIFQNLGTAERVRVLLDRYGSPYDETTATADRALVDLEIARAGVGRAADHDGCSALSQPLSTPGVDDHGLGSGGTSAEPVPVRLWAPEPFTVDVRRFGEEWVRLVEAPARRVVTVTLPALHSTEPWEVRADGACVLEAAAPGP